MGIFHKMHEQPVPGGLSFLQFVDCHSAIKPSWVLNLQSVGKQSHLDMATAHELAVIPMGYGIDYGLTQSDLRVLRNVLPVNASNEATLAHTGHHVGHGAINNLFYRALELAVIQETFS